MIAIFTHYPIDFTRGRFSGKKRIIVIKDTSCIRGVTFSSVVELNVWYKNKKLIDTHEALKIQQPELFVKFKSIT